MAEDESNKWQIQTPMSNGNTEARVKKYNELGSKYYQLIKCGRIKSLHTYTTLVSVGNKIKGKNVAKGCIKSLESKSKGHKGIRGPKIIIIISFFTVCINVIKITILYIWLIKTNLRFIKQNKLKTIYKFKTCIFCHLRFIFHKNMQEVDFEETKHSIYYQKLYT